MSRARKDNIKRTEAPATNGNARPGALEREMAWLPKRQDADREQIPSSPHMISPERAWRVR